MPKSCSDTAILRMMEEVSDVWNLLYLEQMFILLPLAAYLFLNTVYPPHDCYKCFGKDPNHRYSIHQFSKEDKQL
jgi:hypothetical protein